MRINFKTHKLCRAGYVALGLLVVCVWVLMGVCGLLAEWHFEKRLAAYRQVGEPTQLSEISGFFQREDGGKNVRGILLASGREFERSQSQVAERVERPLLPFVEQGRFDSALWTVETVLQAKQYLAERHEFLDAIREVGAEAVCFTDDYAQYSRYGQIRRPLVQVVLEGSRHLCLSALVDVEEGRIESALDDLLCAQRLSRLLCSEPFLYNTVSTMQAEIQILHTVRAVMSRNVLTEQQSEQLLEWRPVDVSLLQKGIVLERLAGLDFYYAMDKGVSQQDPVEMGYLSLFPKVIAYGKIKDFLDVVDESRAVFDFPESEWLQAAGKVEAYMQESDPYGSPLLVLTPPIRPLVEFYQRYRHEARRVQVGKDFGVRNNQLQVVSGK